MNVIFLNSLKILYELYAMDIVIIGSNNVILKVFLYYLFSRSFMCVILKIDNFVNILSFWEYLNGVIFYFLKNFCLF